MKKRLLVIRTGEKIQYVIQYRNIFRRWKIYPINEYIYKGNVINHYIVLNDKETANFILHWKDVKYLNKIIKIELYDNEIDYRVFDNKHINSMHKKHFETLQDAKQYINELPRIIATI